MNEKIVNKIRWFASFMAVAMYLSYVDQIRLNLAGQTGSLVLPIIATVNCFAWTLYAVLKAKTDWPIVIANVPGIILGIITAVTTVL